MVAAATILVVDDEPDLADVVATALAMSGHTVETVGDGFAALQELSRRPYDLVVSDVQMPRLNGLALYDRVAWSHPAMVGRFVFVSADVNRPAIRAFLNRTGVQVLQKPIDIAALQQTVDMVLARAAARNRAREPADPM